MFNNSTNNFLLGLVKDKPHYVVGGCILSLSSCLFSAIAILLLLPILFIIFNIATADLSWLIDFFVLLNENTTSDSGLSILVFLVFLSSAVSVASNYFYSIVNLKHTKNLVYEMKRKSFYLLSKVDWSYYQQNKTGTILFQVNREIDKAALAVKGSQKILITSIDILFFTFVLIFVSLKLSIITAALVIPSFLINSYMGDRMRRKEALLSRSSKAYNHKTVEFLTGIHHIKSTANEAEECQSIIDSLKVKNNAEINAQTFSSLVNPINQFFGLLIILVLTFSSYYLFDGQIQLLIPILLVYVLILFRLLGAIDRLNAARRQVANHRLSADIVATFFHKIDRPSIKSGKTVLSKLKQYIELQNVSFAYPERAKIVLDRVNFKVFKGENIALIGSAGAGKSTIVRLLSRFYEPIEGDIVIDNKSIEEYTIQSLRKSVVVLDREPFLFDNSILYNLTYGLKDITEAEAIAAAKKLKTYDAIEKISQSFSSTIDNISTISESQKISIAITRAFLSNPEIVILDETMAKIHKSDLAAIQNSIDELCRGRTTIVITNRLATIRKADRIIVLNKGKVVESGTHEELLKNSSLYQRMCSAQFKSSQQSHQQWLARKISQKLSHQNNSSLSSDIRSNLTILLNYLQLIDEASTEDNLEQEKILDKSYQSAKNMLASLREYERKISQRLKNES